MKCLASLYILQHLSLHSLPIPSFLSVRYVAAPVEHCANDIPTACGTFVLHQGIQRRLRVTVGHERRPDVVWKDVKEVVVGRIRKLGDCADDVDCDGIVLSLSLFPTRFLEPSNDNRCVMVTGLGC